MQGPLEGTDRSCDGGVDVVINSGYQNFFGDYVNTTIHYHLSLNCSTVLLTQATVGGGYVPSNNPVYWDEFKYANYHATCYIGPYLSPVIQDNKDYSYSPNKVQSAGYNAMTHLSWFGTDCGGGVIGAKYEIVGPLD